MRQRVAVIGSGIAGLSAAHHLNKHVELSLFEAGSYFGGHTHTVDVTLPGPQGPMTHGVDTGFLVYNQRTYPGLIALFESRSTSAPQLQTCRSLCKQIGTTAAKPWSGMAPT
jgi:uncharacterized protein